MTTSLSRRAGLCALLAGTCLSAPALAQLPGSIPAPPVRQNVDEHGVDVLRGTFNTAQTPLSIGADPENGFAYTFQSFNAGYRDAFQAFLSSAGSTYTVTMNGASETFTYNGSSFDSTEGSGSTLTGSLGMLTYTARDGTTVTFQLNTGGAPFYDAPQYRPLNMIRPNGLKVTYLYKRLAFCLEPAVDQNEQVYCPTGKNRVAERLQSVTNSNGYMLKFSYAADTIDPLGAGTDYESWSQLSSVKAINLGSEFCNGAADSCSLAQSWPQATFLRVGNQYTVTDSANRATRYTSDSSARMTAIKRPGAATDNVTIAYGASGVSTLTREGVSYSYGYVDSGSTRTTTVTDPLGKFRVYVGDTVTNLLTSVTNELGQTTSYQHDAKGRVIRVTAPEGNYTQYTYDARGNVIEVRQVAKAGSGLADIVTTAGYDAGCANPKTCNKPYTTTDAAGAVTDYTYDATHGGVLTVTLPAPTAGAARPQSRYAYTGVQGYYRQSAGGSPAASGQTTYLLTGTSACQNNAGCVGTADETKSVIAYGPQSAGTASNLLPVSTSAGAGDGSLTATTAASWDAIGNRTHVDGPLAGTADTSRTIYDAARQVVGVIGPDPDGGGALKHRAARMTHNADGQVTLAEQGTTNGQSDSHWAAFSSLQQVQSTFDSNARKTKDAMTASGTTYSVAQYSHDALGRLDCTALRMNPAVFASLPSSACSLGSQGSQGPDRITKATYDWTSRLTKTESGYGTAEVGSDGSLTFTNNGQVQTFTDGEGHITTLEYDGFDRLAKTRYPLASGGGSSTTDYAGATYDSRGNVTQARLRDGQTIGFAYDALGRLTYKDIPSQYWAEFDISYSYDLLGRLKQALDSGTHVASFVYDALGRRISEASNWTTRTMMYDLAGRRTRLTWGDGFFVDYDYLTTGEVSAIRENGATGGVGVLATYSYDDLGRRTLLSRGNGAQTGYSYDPASRMTNLSQNVAGTTWDLALTFAYNPAGQIASRTSNNDAYAWTGAANVDAVETSNGLNQLVAQGATGLGYDGRGNVSSVGSTTYAYTSENRLHQGGNVTLTWDPLGRFHWLSPAASFAWMQYDGTNLIEERNEGGVQRRYVHGPGTDEPLVWYEGSGTAIRRWLHADERGSIVAASDASGNVVGINKYDEYGQPQGSVTGRFAYTGQAWLPEIGLHYYKARLYHAGLGRFMQTDPIGYAGGQNLYGYVAGDPVNLLDPSGTAVVELNPHVKPIDPTPRGDPNRLPGPETFTVWGRKCNVCSSPNSMLDNFPGLVYGAGPGPGGDAGVDGPDIVVFAPEEKPEKKQKDEQDLERCVRAVATAGLEGFIDPISVIAGAGKSIFEARERIGEGDYGRSRDGRFPRDWGHAAKLGFRRFLPGYLQASIITGGVKATFEFVSNPACQGGSR